MPQPSPLLKAPHDVTLLAGDAKIVANKALLSLLSPVLREAFAIEPDCKELKVEGDPKAWRFAADYMLMSTPDRLAWLEDDSVASAQLMALVLPIARQYNMAALMQDCTDFAMRWTDLSPQGGHRTPRHMLWWLALADEYDCMAFAAASIHSLVKESSYSGKGGWKMARDTVLLRGRERVKQGSNVWRMVVRILDDTEDVD